MKKYSNFRWFCLIIALAIFLSNLTACGGDAPDGESTPPTTSSSDKTDPLAPLGSVGLEYAVNEDGVTCSITGIGECTDTELVIPQKIDGYTVTAIARFALRGRTKITDIVVPNSVTSIGASAFENCNKLESITLPNGITRIESATFKDCSSLESLTIPTNVTYIARGAFKNCTELIQTEGGVSYVNKWAIEYDFQTPLVVLREGTIGIGAETFAKPGTGMFYLTNDVLKTIRLPEGLLYINDAAFIGCTKILSIPIPTTVVAIGVNAFHSCSNLTSMVVPKRLALIPVNCFYKCSDLTDIVIHKEVTAIGLNAFLYCFNLSKIYYTGSAEDWAKIDIDEHNIADMQELITVYYYSENQPTAEGNFWHYVNDTPTIWEK